MNFSWPFKKNCCIQIILGDEYPPLAVVKKNEKILEEVTPQINNFIYGRYFSKKMQRAAFCISRKVHRFWGRGATSRGRNQCMKHSSAPLGKLAEGWKWQVLSSFTVSGKFHGICRFFVRVDVPTLLSKACYILYIYNVYHCCCWYLKLFTQNSRARPEQFQKSRMKFGFLSSDILTNQSCLVWKPLVSKFSPTDSQD